MKQHITVEQLDELDDESHLKLLEWYESTLKTAPQKLTYSLDAGIPLLSIGQMIEFLGDHSKALIITNALRLFHNNELLWHIASSESKKKSIEEDDFINNDDLCDALWEAVKKELEYNPLGHIAYATDLNTGKTIKIIIP